MNKKINNVKKISSHMLPYGPTLAFSSYRRDDGGYHTGRPDGGTYRIIWCLTDLNYTRMDDGRTTSERTGDEPPLVSSFLWKEGRRCTFEGTYQTEDGGPGRLRPVILSSGRLNNESHGWHQFV